MSATVSAIISKYTKEGKTGINKRAVGRMRKRKENKTLSSWYTLVTLVNFPKCHCETRPPQFIPPESKTHTTQANIWLNACFYHEQLPYCSAYHLLDSFFFFFYFHMAKATIRGNGSNVKFLAGPLSFQILGKIIGLASMCPTLFLSSINKQLGLSFRERRLFATQMIH